MTEGKLAKISEFQSGVLPRKAPSSSENGSAGPNPALPPPTATEKEAPAPTEAWARLATLALKHLDRFLSLEPKVLKGDDPGAIHDIRVATRRLQAAMDLLFSKPRPAEVRKLRRRIKRYRRAFSEVRNYDVAIAKVDSVLARKRTARREAWAAFRSFLDERRSECLAGAAPKLSKANLASIYIRLKSCLEVAGQCSGGPPGSLEIDAAGKASRSELETRLAARFADARRIFEEHLTACLTEPNARAGHQVRIAAKRLRYLIEVLREFNVAGSSEALIWFRGLQQHLGNWHDANVLERMMIEMIARRDYLRNHLDLAFSIGKLIVKARRSERGIAEQFVRMSARSAEYRQIQEWLDYLVASPSAALANA